MTAAAMTTSTADADEQAPMHDRGDWHTASGAPTGERGEVLDDEPYNRRLARAEHRMELHRHYAIWSLAGRRSSVK
jgi:hypothetical protein